MVAVRILQLHSDSVVYTPVEKEISIADEAEKKETRVEDVVLLLTAVEEGDDEELAQKAIDDVRAFLGKLKVNRILIYPYAHLSSKLAKPAEALKLLKAMEAYAKQKGIETYRAPFGWNKRFAVSVKGHPLAEQSRSYAPAVVEAGAEAKEASPATVSAFPGIELFCPEIVSEPPGGKISNPLEVRFSTFEPPGGSKICPCANPACSRSFWTLFSDATKDMI